VAIPLLMTLLACARVEPPAESQPWYRHTPPSSAEVTPLVIPAVPLARVSLQSPRPEDLPPLTPRVEPPTPVEFPPLPSPVGRSAAVGNLIRIGGGVTGSLGNAPVRLHETGRHTTGTIGNEPVMLHRRGNTTTGRVGNRTVHLQHRRNVTTGRIGDQLVIIRGP
jgi:hypothetical protein